MDNLEETVGPAGTYRHDHPPVVNVHEEFVSKMTRGQKIADHVASAVGSWPFILIQSGILAIWILANVYLAMMISSNPSALKSWDPYPFILLNLVLSFQAAYTGPVVMMSQNRQSEKDRIMATNDYEINKKAEEEISVIMEHLVHQDQLILTAVKTLESFQLTEPLKTIAQKVDDLLIRVDENDRKLMEHLRNIQIGKPE